MIPYRRACADDRPIGPERIPYVIKGTQWTFENGFAESKDNVTLFKSYGRSVHVVDTDHLYINDPDKYYADLNQVYGNTSNEWNKRSPATIETFLQLHLDDKSIELIKVSVCSNSMQGMPVWSFHYRAKKKTDGDLTAFDRSNYTTLYDNGKRAFESAFSDRLSLHAACQDSLETVCGNGSQDWSELSPDMIEAFLRNYYRNEYIVLTQVLQSSNPVTGDSVWCFCYRQDAKSKDKQSQAS